MPPRYDPAVIQAIVRASRQSGIDPTLMTAVSLEESGLNPRAVGDQGTSYGLTQLHQGGALGNLSPQAAMDPYTNIGVAARGFAKVGGRGLAAGPESLTRYYRDFGRGSSVTGPTSKALAYLPQARQLVSQYGGGAGTTTPAVGAQQQTAAGAQAPGLSPQLMAGLQSWLKSSGEQALAGTYAGGIPAKLLSQLTAAHQRQAEVPQVRGATSPGGAPRFTGAIPGAMAGTDYPLGAKGPIIGTPYSGTHTLGNWESDRAVDIRVPVGTPVVAPADGVIGSQIGALGSSSSRMAGLRVHIDGATDNFYLAHLSSLAAGIKPGAHVRAGDVIGYSGSANGVAHLHFASQNRDPRSYVGS
jgi:murein DD-endopeptidase MepM/ murein hydrolase activator NlpD